MKRVVVAMSGGVDSSAAALLLRREGFDCRGVMLWLFGDTEPPAAEGARRVAEALSMPFTLIDAREVFRRTVTEPFAADYAAGLVPNPCVRCNRAVKFGFLADCMRESGADMLATGHYARLVGEGSARRLLRAADPEKDQSYFLHILPRELLHRLCFPLGDFADKSEVRALVREAGLPTAERKDSQDICFVEDGDYAAYLRRQGVSFRAGDFVDAAGRPLGRHKGLPAYTRGQRKGLGVSAGERLYVLSKDSEKNTVLLGREKDLYTDTLWADGANWLTDPPAEPLTVTAKTRYSRSEAAATVYPPENGLWRVTFSEPQRAVTAGQSVVFYRGEEVLGGAVIRITE